MATLKQIEAARRNGAKSKGPITAEGKLRSSQNSTKHGLTGKKLLVLSTENDEEFLAFVQEWEEKLKPADNIERGFVLQAAAARWRLERAWSLETVMLDRQMEERGEFLKKYRRKEFESMDDSSRQADAFRTLVGQSSAFDAISRYETRLSREYDRAIKGLERIRALAKRQPVPNEPESAVASDPPSPQNEQNEPNISIIAPQTPRSSVKPSAEHEDLQVLQNEPNHQSDISLPDRPAA